jgi:acetyltransferase-like isoleucine patch superfamily enzyme
MARDRLRESTLCLLSEAAGPSVALKADALSGSYSFGLYDRITTCCYSATVLHQHIREHIGVTRSNPEPDYAILLVSIQLDITQSRVVLRRCQLLKSSHNYQYQRFNVYFHCNLQYIVVRQLTTIQSGSS